VKERLTGAIILVALLVLLVPELLTGPSRSVRSAQPVTTAADGAQMRSYTIDLADDAAHRSATAPVTEAPAPDAKPADPTGESTEPGGNVDQSAAQAPDASDASSEAAQSEQSAGAAPTTSEPPTPSATAGRADAERPASARADAPTSASGTRTEPKPAATPRVEAPKPAPVARAEAPKPAQAAPIRADPPPAPRVSEPPARAGTADSKPDTKPASGWAVQVGSFASRDNAERLARQLKGKGFAATVSQSPKGKRLWRVRVGPEADRAAAVALGAKLRSAGQSGAVVPYP